HTAGLLDTPEPVSRYAEARQQMIMERRVGFPRERDERFVCEVRRPENFTRGEAVVAREVHGHVFPREEWVHFQIVVFLGVEEEAEIGVAPREPFSLWGGGQVSHVGLEGGLDLVQGREKTEKPFD